MTKKLLLADDSVTIQRVIGIIFATEDYQLLVTDNGDEAYEKAQQEGPDLVIADVSMPGKDGFELCEALKNDPRLAKTAVLLLPGTFDHFDEERARAVGADGWLSKPFESQALLDKVEQLLAAEPVTPAVSEQPQDDEFAEPAENLSGKAAAAIAAASAPATAFSELEAEPASELEFELDSGDEEAASEVDAVDLGLESIGAADQELAPEETATEDIWDAVSFEDEELDSVAAETEQAGFEDLATADGGDLLPETAESPFSKAEVNIDAESIGFAAAEETAPNLDSPSGFDHFVSDSDDLHEFEAEAPMGLGEAGLSEKVSEHLGRPADAAKPSAPMSLAPKVEDRAAAEQSGDLLELGPFEDAEEEILELAEEDILTEADAGVAGEASGEPLSAVETGDDIFQLSEESVAGFEQADKSVAEATPADLDTNEDEDGFFFDAAGEDEDEDGSSLAGYGAEEFMEEATESATGELATGVSAAAATALAAAPDVSDEAPIEQVEQQLRELSEEDLKAVVAKVAGPMIEKLANEMLEQIAWEVVPDLAESMIREEIRRLKQGVE